MHLLLPDTNVFLHFERLDQIDWCAVVGSDVVTVVIAQVVLRELGNHAVAHRSKKLRERAHKSVKWLARLHGDSEAQLRADVLLEFQSSEPQVDFASHGLRRDTADDHIPDFTFSMAADDMNGFG